MRKRDAGVSLVAVLAVSVAGVLSSGCMSTGQVTPSTPVRVHGAVGVVATSVPSDIQAYPHVRWHGRDAYFADGRWYYPSDQGWLVLEQVPRDLRGYEQQWAAQPGYGAYPQGAPPPPSAGYYGYPGSPYGERAPYRQAPPSAPFPSEIGGYPVEPAPAPPDLSRAPRAPFAGGQAYFVNGRWYYPTPSGWAVFRTSPAELGRWRTPIGGGAVGYPPSR